MSEIESISMTITSNKEKNLFKEIKWINNNYPIRCPDCSNICLIDNINIQKEKFTIKCDNQHINNFDSFEDFSNQVIKLLNDIICNKCKCDNSLDINNMERCNACFLFFCKKCISEHKEKEGHENNIELDKIDTFCYRHKIRNKYFNNNNKYHICKDCYDKLTEDKCLISTEDFIRTEELFPTRSSITQEYKEIEKTIQKCENLIEWINEWKDDMFKKIKKLDDFLINYYSLKKSIIEHLNNNDNYTKYKNNLYVLLNYEMLTKFKEIENYVDKSIKEISKYKREDLFLKSNIFLDVINGFSFKLNDINKDLVKNSLIEENNLIIEQEKEKSKLKLKDMNLNKYKITNNITCFTLINDKNIILGTDIGDIRIYESPNSKDKKAIITRLEIKEFKNPIKFICEIDKNTIAVSDKIGKIKIFELNENIINYSLIQGIKSEEQKTVYAMIYLPILSYYKNRHHFCIANSDYMFIYKSNKQPKNLLILKENYHDTIQEISIEQPTFIMQENNNMPKEYNQNNQNNNDSFSFNLINKIILNAVAYSLIEINEKYIAAAYISFDNNYFINFFDVNNNFELEKEINTDMIYGGNYIMNLVDNRKVLVVGSIKGFYFISINNLEIIKYVNMNMGIISIGVLYDNTMICCAIDDDKKCKKLLEIRYIPESCKIKISDGFVKLEGETWDLKCFNNKIYFILNSSINIFQK